MERRVALAQVEAERCLKEAALAKKRKRKGKEEIIVADDLKLETRCSAPQISKEHIFISILRRQIEGKMTVAAIVSWFPISILVNRIVPEQYMDEIFHIPHVKQYCKGNFGSWDPMITTPPGLYVSN
ncbi:Dol-P-Glc:Glc(2)Man(9)GlcNAc(2)-PP-Dol alpha-1,2-glucosyltransferase [Quillaja saponaria]|uniref:Dol-P-Glc:Glc(2)Man(9)GlcNAc(2)-PP-Dol alpha-1,2-glucosyltransferase n=1 Tax=Quillaja saponaria TaxID=32244 RepID=A0AAD7LKL9_QUISA|nr:Dol-P-Glc:Glc(2)Man(9)GlcNAc(2)-PP-Dol alpha-1,2-glucosyltransferase [Quillaja saponaria]